MKILLRKALLSIFFGLNILIAPFSESTTVVNDLPRPVADANGLPLLDPAPPANPEVWECEVVVVGGSLGGLAATYHAMKLGVKTCMIELTPMIGGQITAQGVSAIDESTWMRKHNAFSESWTHLKKVIGLQAALPPSLMYLKPNALVKDTNGCWVGKLCFLPTAGASAAIALLEEAKKLSPSSQWGTEIAFKGADFNPEGNLITAIHAVRRKPRDRNYLPMGRLSRELRSWYAWEPDQVFEKQAIRLQPLAGRQMIVIDATDTGELVGWAGLPFRVGSESRKTTGEVNAVSDNSDCTQAFTFPFILSLSNDEGRSLKKLKLNKPGYSRKEHERSYNLGRFPMFVGNSLFNYRRVFSMEKSDPFTAVPDKGDMTIINWNQGNDWGVMDPPLIMTNTKIRVLGQRQNWLGGLDLDSLKEAENHALLFSEWLLSKQATSEFPLRHMAGKGTGMPTESGLSMYPYIREGRRILGRPAYGQSQFLIREQDIHRGQRGRDFSRSAIALTHYAIDMHGCRYRNGEPSGSASSAPTKEDNIRPIEIPLEALIPQKIDNLLIGGKAIAVTHIVNAATRIHVGEWKVGSAAGAIAAWVIRNNLMPQDLITQKLVPQIQQVLVSQGMVIDDKIRDLTKKSEKSKKADTTTFLVKMINRISDFIGLSV